MTKVGTANRSHAQMRAQTYSPNHYKMSYEELMGFNFYEVNPRRDEDYTPFNSLKQRIEEDRKNDR